MAEIKNCEQYVVDKLQTVEMLLEQENQAHERDVIELTEELNKTKSILADAQNLLEFVAEQFRVRPYDNTAYISFEIWEKYDKKKFDRLIAEFGLELPKKSEETENA